MAEYISYKNLQVVELPAARIRKVKIVQLGALTMGQWWAKQTDKPRYMLNASLWDAKGPIGTIWLGGQLVRNEGNGYGFGTDAGRWDFGCPWDHKREDYITGYPALIVGGQAQAGFPGVTYDVISSVTRRAAVCQRGGALCLVTGKTLNLQSFRAQLAAYGMEEAVNLDGGGSARLMIDGKAVNDPTDDRACKLAIAVWVNETAAGPEKEEKNMHKVFLGVGHGGKDPGAVADGYREKDMTLAIALACQDELARHGVLVKMSRTTDEDDPLTEEIRECNAFAPELALDIHINAGGGAGFEAFHTLSGGAGKTLAQSIESEVKALGQTSRGCKTRVNSQSRDYYGFIRLTVCPAVIAEYGFIDNPADREKFDEAAEQEAIGKAYARGILRALGVALLPEESVDTPDEVSAACAVLREKAGLADETVDYLLAYRYGTELVKRLAGCMEG